MNFCAGILNAVPQEGPEQVGLLMTHLREEGQTDE